ncbi:outer membrane beta-barrel protein [Mucilaginibacter calamicampi]|uniref:Outer membrane beta-barrel protein n=1 Tax=Mucilaginibacter calamicampi TaxID=1302352 RepID=A0ABW2YVP1_9SPHI
MKIAIASIVLFFACVFSCAAQSPYNIKGVVVDTVDKVKIRATVTVINAKDSILVKFDRSNGEGAFNITGLPAGNFSLWITHPDYADYTEKFTLDAANPEHNFSSVNLLLRERVLNEVKIKGKPIELRIKGDTSIIDARAYVIQPNDKVEDLLKQVPGMTVDKDGKVTFMGEQIKKFLVDGEEFFGDDPLLVTRNLRADMVDKMQVYDRKSDQASITGIDDGVKVKTLNVKLREDKKNGMFGKVSAGVGNSGYYNGQAMANKFKGNYKLSVYGTTANNGINGLGDDDAMKLGAASTNTVTFDDGSTGTYFGSGDDIDNSYYNGRGFPSARTGGVHFDTKLNDGKQSINTNYKIGVLALTDNANTLTQQNLPASVEITDPADKILNKSSDRSSYSHTFRQRGDLTFQSNPNASTSLKIAVDGTFKDIDNNSSGLSIIENGAGKLLTRETQTQTETGTQKAFNASFLYSKKFKKPNRVFSWNVSETYNESNSKLQFNSLIFSPDKAPTDSKIDQYKPTTIESSVLNSNVTYNEPLSKTLSLGLNYGLGFNNSSSDRASFNRSISGKYDAFDSEYSNSYKFNQVMNQLGAIFSYKSADTKTTLTFGTRASGVNFKQIDQYTGNIYKRSFVNWSPQTRFQHKLGPSQYISIQYNGSNSQPTIEQIQPIRINTDPTNITLGNPNLGPSFGHNISAGYNFSQEITGKSFYINASYNFIANPIISNITVDKFGRSVIQYVNLTDKMPGNYRIYANMNRKMGMFNTGFNLSTNANTTYSYSNGAINQSKNNRYSANVRIGADEAKKYYFSISGGPSYNFVSQSLQSQDSYSSAGFDGYAYFSLYLPAKFQVGADMNYYYQGAVPNAPAVSQPLVNAYINRAFFKNESLKLAITGNNLFNITQNYRDITATGFNQTSYAGVRRYFMVTLSWDFTKFGTNDTPAN